MSKLRGLSALLLVLLIVNPLASESKVKLQTASPIHLDREGEKWAEKTLKKMSLEQKIGQMFMIWSRVSFTNSESPDYKQLRDTMLKYHIGSFCVTVPVDGPFLQRSEPYEAAALANQLQKDAEFPLIMAADFERGVSMRLIGTSVFPHSMAFGAAGSTEFAESFGRITAEEARAIGVQWNFFPIADVNSNPQNPIINTRSFGEDPKQVAELLAAYIRGAHQAGMLTTAKHFPGHGDTATDSHLGLAKVGGDLQRLESVELPPFKAAMEAGVDAVMVAHVTTPALEPNPDLVATTSHKIVTELLKDKMGFNGIVLTDAMDMNALMRIYANSGNSSGAAAVAAVKAGNDLLIIPQDLDGAYNGLLNAARSGEIPESQINGSVRKILRAKASVGLNRSRFMDLEAVGRIVGRPINVEVGQQVADAAITLVRENGQFLPLRKGIQGTSGQANPYTVMEKSGNQTVAVVFSEDVRSESGRMFERQLKSRIPDATVIYVDPRIAAGMTAEVMAVVQKAGKILIPVYVIPTAGKRISANGELKNTVALSEPVGSLLEKILQTAGERTMVLAMGNPYLASDFPQIKNYICTFSSVSVSETSAVKALFGEIPIKGRLPVSIPAIADRGSGMVRPAEEGKLNAKSIQ